jgi:hypothetical protein
MTDRCQAFCLNVLKHSGTMEMANKTDVRYMDAASKNKANVLLYTFRFSTYKNLYDNPKGNT